MDKRKFLKAFILLRREIKKVEENLVSHKYFEGFLILEDLHQAMDVLYETFEEKGDWNSMWEIVENIEKDGFNFDFNLLTEEQTKELTNDEGDVSIVVGDYEKYPNAIVKLKGLDNIIDYVIKTYGEI